MSELKPCPFCGSHSIEIIGRDIHCECGINYAPSDLDPWRDVVKHWNQRAELPEPPEDME